MPKTRPYVIAADPAPEDRRESKKARTRDDLVAAALHLFSEKGFGATTVEDIASTARVSPRTFFRYFGIKEEVLFHRREQDLIDLEAALAARPAGESPLQALRAVVVDFMERFQAERDFHLLRIAIISESRSVQAYSLQLLQEWARALARVLARRMRVDPQTDLRPVLLASCAVMAMRSALTPWTQARGATDIGALTEHAFDLLEGGFRS